MKKTVLVLITFALVIAVAGSGFWLVHYFIDSREQKETYKTLAEEFVLESTPSVRPESSSSLDSSVDAGENNVSSPVESPDTPPRHDLAALAAENPDCVGWLTIPNTEIDYPVMHTPNDPEHYLRRDFYGDSASGGTPFLDGRNAAQTKGQNLILYLDSFPLSSSPVSHGPRRIPRRTMWSAMWRRSMGWDNSSK